MKKENRNKETYYVYRCVNGKISEMVDVFARQIDVAERIKAPYHQLATAKAAVSQILDTKKTYFGYYVKTNLISIVDTSHPLKDDNLTLVESPCEVCKIRPSLNSYDERFNHYYSK